MIVEIKVPSPGESIAEVEIGKWLVENGALVRKDQELAEVESDKATLSLIATASGQLTILVKEGERVAVGSVACNIDTEKAPSQPAEKQVVATPSKQVSAQSAIIEGNTQLAAVPKTETVQKEPETPIKMTPTAKAVMEQANLSVDEVLEGLRRLTRRDMEQIVTAYTHPVNISLEASRAEDRVTMTPLRRKLSQRLVAVKNETAMLTTFNEVDMSKVMELRNRYQKVFTEKHGFKLGFNAFFAKAVSLALLQHTSINSMIDGEEIVTPKYHDIGIAVSSPKGLMVPVIRNVETMSVAQIEGAIKDLAEKARDKRLTVQEMTGGTFTITNGGVFGSMMSTPIINPP
ncbi:MAG: 2-oxo acid dehydrogenase subunit E2, partial [Bacteroidetes bacterium]|nr:2-oxo acid dehydrogenase subunit E2 [Bacteroidota bacterium]